ncbi:MAG TPA: AraC family transcriptional regulator [Terriglobales bacterium]|nr:AraC family transcriptional regulator [Terriglobales bacterium]
MLNVQEPRAKRPYTVELHSRAIERVINAIRGRLDESISLGEMASVAYMSRFHFNRTFRQITGIPPRRFLSALRVEAATRMLLNTDHTVTDICLDVGYSSLGTFIRRFSEVLGVSPMRLRSLRRSSTKTLLEGLETAAHDSMVDSMPAIKGRIQTPASFSGLIFVGLFPSAIPEGAPIACAINLHAGSFLIKPVPTGCYYLLALGLPTPDSVDDYFRYESALRGGGEFVHIKEGILECADITLRAPVAIDPPILLNLPSLLNKYHGTQLPS